MFLIPVDLVTIEKFSDVFGNIYYKFIALSMIVFVSNIIISFKIGFYDNGFLEMNNLKIIKHYF